MFAVPSQPSTLCGGNVILVVSFTSSLLFSITSCYFAIIGITDSSHSKAHVGVRFSPAVGFSSEAVILNFTL